MPNHSDPDSELTPQGTQVLKGIIEDTKALRELDLGDTPPATIFEAD